MRALLTPRYAGDLRPATIAFALLGTLEAAAAVQLLPLIV